MYLIRQPVIFFIFVGIGFAQSDITEGIRLTGGIAYSTVSGQDVHSEDGVKFHLGYKIGVEKALNTTINAGLNLVERGYNTSKTESNVDGTYKVEQEFSFQYISTYVYKSIPINNFKFYIGPELNYFLNAKFSINVSGGSHPFSDSQTWDIKEWKNADGKTFDYGIILGMVYPFTSEICLSANYFYGLSKWAKDLKAMNRSVQIFVSYDLF